MVKKYFEYMDNVTVSDTLHQRLLNLETPKKRPVWKKYGTVAAALVLVAGLGAWGANALGLSRGAWAALARQFSSEYISCFAEPSTQPEIADLEIPDIAVVDPNEAADPSMKTIGGYEVTDGEMVTYHILPYIEYGFPTVSADLCLAPPDGGLRDATADDALAVVGGEEALRTHLDWGGCEFSGDVGFETDGTVWMLTLWAESEEFAFSLQLSPGRMPPSCVRLPEDAYTWTEVWGVKVAGFKGGAYGNTERGVYMDVGRRVEFLANGVGCRLQVYGTQEGTVEEIVSRFVRYAILEGLDLSGVSPEGAAPLDTAPGYSVGEPNREDSASDYDPQGAAAPSPN